MAAYLWSGTVTFGLVTIPVHMLPAVSARPVRLTMLHAKDAAPLERRMICPRHDKVVKAEHQVRGFEITRGEYVVVTDEELESLSPERSQAIEIEEFVDLGEIDPLYFDRPYYLEPGKGADKPYWLLAQVLRDTGQAGIAKLVMKEREYLVAVWVVEDVLSLTTLRHERQRVSPEGIAPERTRVSHAELDTLTRHINQTTRRFDPSAYTDDNELRLMELIRKQASEEGVAKSPRSRRRTKISGKRLTSKIDDTIRELKSGR